MNKDREKNEKRENKRKTIRQLMMTVQCLTCKAPRAQEIGLAYFGALGISVTVGGNRRAPERRDGWLPRSILRRKKIYQGVKRQICLWGI